MKTAKVMLDIGTVACAMVRDEVAPVSYKYEVMTIYRGEESWAGNAIRMATKEEADAAGNELLSRWYVPESYRVMPSDDPVNYQFINGRPRRIEEDMP